MNKHFSNMELLNHGACLVLFSSIQGSEKGAYGLASFIYPDKRGSLTFSTDLFLGDLMKIRRNTLILVHSVSQNRRGQYRAVDNVQIVRESFEVSDSGNIEFELPNLEVLKLKLDRKFNSGKNIVVESVVRNSAGDFMAVSSEIQLDHLEVMS